MRHIRFFAVLRVKTKTGSRWLIRHKRTFLKALLFLVMCYGTVSALANEAVQQEIREIEQSLTNESMPSPQSGLAGQTKKYEIEKFSMAYCDRITTFEGGNLSLSCNPTRTEASMIVVRLYTPASGIRTAYKRGTFVAKMEKKDFRGWIRESDPRYFYISPPKGLNEMLAKGKGLSPHNSVTMALYADHTAEPLPQGSPSIASQSTTKALSTANSTVQTHTTGGDAICKNLPYTDTADSANYGQPYILESEIGSDQAKLQLRCDPEVRQIQAVRVIMAEAVALATAGSIDDKGTAVVRLATIGESVNRAIVTEWVYQRESNNQFVFSPKRQIDEREIYGFFESGETREALMKLAFVNEANNMSKALESASAIPITLLDKTQRRSRIAADIDEGW